ncbi:ParB N-terminal domain-containing protein [Enterocloster citroniae]|uniref:ParB/RepB/Spo0J family partition protein n=1 Tax=Enterocloster citroniae TaxID=358743 RepID=UPI00349E6876
MILKISDVKIGQRVRDEYGDMEALADSIKEHGLLHPIVVDSDYNLIAGCRRLLACERIGLTEIEAKVLEDISEKELRVLELEENIRRKDLTELEKSKNLVELAEIKEQELKEKEYFAESAKKSRGQPQKVNGLKQVAEEIGVPIKTLHDAKQHVKAVEEFPPLADLPKYQAMETAKELRKASPEDQGKIIDLAQRRVQTTKAQTADEYSAYIDECWKMTKKYHKAINAFMWIQADEKELRMLSEIIHADTAPGHLREVEDSIAKLSRVRNFLKGVIEHDQNKKAGT